MASNKKVIHLMTQDDQPYGSQRKCCERCGTAMWHFQWYFDEKRHFTKEKAEEYNGIRCIDIKEEDNGKHEEDGNM